MEAPTVRSQMELVAKIGACLPPIDPLWVAAQAALVAGVVLPAGVVDGEEAAEELAVAG
jgi:hypothetical protein